MQSLVSDKKLVYDGRKLADLPATSFEEDILYSDTAVFQQDRLLGPNLLDVTESNVAANRLSTQIESRGAADIIKLVDTPTLYYRHGDKIDTHDIMTEGLIFENGKLVSLGSCANHKTLRLPSLIGGQRYQIQGSTSLFRNNNTVQTLQIGDTDISRLLAVAQLNKITATILPHQTIVNCGSLTRLVLSNCICRVNSIISAPKLQQIDIYPGTELVGAFIAGNLQQLTCIRLRAAAQPLNVSIVRPGAFRNIPNLSYVQVDSRHAWYSTNYNYTVLYDTIYPAAGKKQDKVLWVSPAVTSFTAPTGVLKIADYCFSKSSRLTTVDFSKCSADLLISLYAFTGNSKTFTIKVPFASTSSQASSAPWGATNATIIYKDS